MKYLRLPFQLLLFFACAACSKKKASVEQQSDMKFTILPAAHTAIAFNNTITENDSVNLIANAYTYMGSGVGIGDFDNDGLMDVFFGASQQSSKLYHNKGSIQFEDITQKAGVQTDVWVTGVSVTDINSDGFDDIYLCVSGNTNAQRRTNLLFINNHDLTFTEQAAEYGLADTSYSTQGLFFDYDKDGDLDLYLLNHLLDHQQSNNIVPITLPEKRPAGDKLYRNNSSENDTHPVFEDVSSGSGILENGYGLGVVCSDFNSDGWPDLYVSNDYLANDILWINNRNGTFSNTIGRSIRHQSYSSMGVDAGDINNDGLPDIVTLDMQPEDNRRKKEMYSFLSYDRYVMERRAGYQEEYMRNMLQLNGGLRSISDTSVPFFSEIGQLAGISETDWSWSALFADLDNDGFKDLHITNGLGRDMLNSDFISFAMGAYTSRAASRTELNKRVVQKLDEYGMVQIPNYCYRNGGNLQFTDVTNSAGLNEPSISNGCAYADLDNDGDLDLVTSNINSEAFICRNELRKTADTTHNYISIKLEGDGANKRGFGARIVAYAGGQQQVVEQAPVRGYLSTMDNRLYVGLGRTTAVDSLVVIWPDGNIQRHFNIQVNQLITMRQSEAKASEKNLFQPKPIFTNVSATLGLSFKHSETFFYDYGPQQTLPQKYSQLGPFLASGDVNGDGLQDFFVGGAAGQAGQLLLQQASGGFITHTLPDSAKVAEDLGCLLFDADKDGDLDLFVNSGGNEFRQGSPAYLPRLYNNDGAGNFSPDPNAVPSSLFTSAQCVAGADYDGDGDIDLFIGGRIWPGQYPAAPASYILQNNGGRFSDVTSEVCAALQNPGMITAAVWADINKDNKPDLIVAGEWMPVSIYINKDKKLEPLNKTGIDDSYGQWRSLEIADLDGDGDLDIVAGNMGRNNRFRISDKSPMKLFAKDLDGNGTTDPIIAYHIKDAQGGYALYPSIGRDQFALQVPLIKKNYLLHADYARANIQQVLAPFGNENMLTLSCNETQSVWLENNGSGFFVMHALPVEAQFAPVNAIICTDADGDGRIDIILAGNEYQAETGTGRYDASYGLLLKGNGKGVFATVPHAFSGLAIDGDVKDIKLIETPGQRRLLVVATNDAPLQVFQVR